MKTRTWLIALCHFAYGWHNGRGRSNKAAGDRVSYRLACLASQAAKRRGIDRPLDVKLTPAMKKVVKHLEDAYIPAEWKG